MLNKKKIKLKWENSDPDSFYKWFGSVIDELSFEEEKRTPSQSNSLFLWFSMIEHEAENQGITWDMVIKHTHQLRITKETLHGMCKSLQKSLWNTTSTKELKKQGNIDIIIDHFTDVLGKAGLETPEFPNDPNKLRPLIEAQKIAKDMDYPEHEGQVTF